MLLADWLNIWSFSDLTTIVFFVLGYLILYAQQSQSQRQLEEAHLELQGAHSRLAASSRQIETLTLLTERQRMARELQRAYAAALGAQDARGDEAPQELRELDERIARLRKRQAFRNSTFICS